MRNGKKIKKKDLRQVAFTRFMLIVAVFVLWIGGIGARLVNLQITQHAWLKERAVDIRQDVKQSRMLRGTIYDRNDRALAMSLRVKTLYADTTEISDTAAAAKVIAKALNLNTNQVANQLKQGKDSKKRFVPLAKKLDEELVQKINKALDTPDVKKADLPNFTGLHWREDQKRSYPYQTLAAQVIGFSNSDDDGRAGIEQSKDDILHGAVIKKLQERDRLGRVYDETTVEREEPNDIVLTIDAAYQYIAEQALENGVRSSQARSGMAIVMNPKNGEILALANYPTYDPNTITDSVAEHIGNKAIQSVYSPGSVFKIVPYGSALEKNLFLPEDKIDAGNGSITVADHKFSDHHTGTMSYSDALAHSSNVCAIKTGMRVGREDFSSMVQKMGFGSKTGIELPAETQGIVRPVDKWNGDSLASMSIGYEISVTALQMVTAFATIANNGVRNQPHIIKEIRRSDEQPVIVTQPQQTQVVKAETAQHLRTMLRQVVLDGTGRRAQLNGYTVAGKTGTAWKYNPKTKSVDSSKYISSFIGMAPADNPEIVVGVVMDEPKGGARDGGMVSAPVFREIAQQILTEMKVATDAPVKPEALVANDIPRAPAKDIKTAKPADAKAEVKQDSISKPKTVTPSAGKDKPVKKTNEKKISEAGKLTALIKRRFDFRYLEWIDKSNFET
ncbi:MAG: penicillin-binding protein 2 [Chloracidobacterium sp.]|nr:penicillin-binding protein 2 [Chloracidobacterium sp.]